MGGKGAGGVGLAGNLVQSDTSIVGGPGGSGSLSSLSTPDLGGDAGDAPHHPTLTPVPPAGLRKERAMTGRLGHGSLCGF